MNSQPRFTTAEIAQLEQAYQQAVYEVSDGKQIISLHIGESNQQIERLLSDRHCQTWALITAHNPYSQCLSAAENQQRHQKLLEYLQDLQLSVIPAVGKDKMGEWTPEQSVFILDISLDEAISIGRLFEQNAIVYGTLTQPPQLQWL